VARPAWPGAPFPAGEVRALQAGHAGLAAIAHDLRTGDVHPPLYFWSVALWRRLVGPGLLAARLFSVLCDLAALAAVAAIARRLAVPPVLAMLLTLGCYGFVYTGAVARGFALAQALTLWGVALLLAAEGRRSRTLAAGMLLGAATFANYLAVFVLLTSPAAMRERSRCAAPRVRVPRQAPCRWGRPHPALRTDLSRKAGEVYAGALPFLLADLWFFLAQRSSRTGQFLPFHLLDALPRLARYAAANLFGGLPLYAPASLQPAAAAALASLTLACAGLVAARWRHIADGPATRLALALAAAAPPIGVLALGLVFNNTPIELRYLAFAVPFAALLLAGALASLPRRPRHAALAVLLSVQTAAIAGLMTRPETMQPWCCCRTAMTASASSEPSPSSRRPRNACWWCARTTRPTASSRASAPSAASCSRCWRRTVPAAPRCQPCARPSPARAGARAAKGSTSSPSIASAKAARQGTLRRFHADPPGAARGQHSRAPRRLRAAAAAAARQPAIALHVAPRGAGAGGTLHRGLPRPARLRLLAQAAGLGGPRALCQALDGTCRRLWYSRARHFWYSRAWHLGLIR
jgi:hypothetical protein